jgi:hypothetical protein
MLKWVIGLSLLAGALLLLVDRFVRIWQRLLRGFQLPTDETWSRRLS